MMTSQCYDYTLSIGGGEAENQIAWNLVKNGVIILAGHGSHEDTLCLEDACYELNMWDTFGDGWNGASYSLKNTDGIYIANGNLDSALDGDGISWGSDVICTEPLPMPPCLFENYILSVTGGSPPTDITWSFAPEGETIIANGGVPSTIVLCLDDGCYTIIMLDAGGDGWNGGTYTLTAVSGGAVVATGTMASGSGPELGYFDVGSGACIILPVELVEFNGQVAEQVNKIWWTTASESNCSHFCIERYNSDDQWLEIGRLDGQGTSSEMNHYTFEDPSYFDGTNYYRLKQVDANGQFEYSHTIALKNQYDFALKSVFPNPSNDEFNLALSTAYDCRIEISLIDLTGRMIHSSVEYLSEGNQSIQLDTPELKNGIYSLVIRDEEGSVLSHKTLVKQ